MGHSFSFLAKTSRIWEDSYRVVSNIMALWPPRRLSETGRIRIPLDLDASSVWEEMLCLCRTDNFFSASCRVRRYPRPLPFSLSTSGTLVCGMRNSCPRRWNYILCEEFTRLTMGVHILWAVQYFMPPSGLKLINK